MSNEDLVAQIQHGNGEALTELWNQNRGICFYIVRRFLTVCPQLEAEDAMQDAFLGLRDAALAFRSEEGCKFTTVLCYYVRNALRNDLRQGWRAMQTLSLQTPLSDDADDAETFEDTLPDESLEEIDRTAERMLVADDVRRAVEELPEEEKAVVLRVYFGTEIRPIGNADRNAHTRAMYRLKRSAILLPYRQEFRAERLRHERERILRLKLGWQSLAMRMSTEGAAVYLADHGAGGCGCWQRSEAGMADELQAHEG